MQATETASAIFAEWQKDETLLARASRGFICTIGKKKSLNRSEVAHNKDALAPVIRHIGFLPYKLKFQLGNRNGCNLFVIRQVYVPYIYHLLWGYHLRPSSLFVYNHGSN